MHRTKKVGMNRIDGMVVVSHAEDANCGISNKELRMAK